MRLSVYSKNIDRFPPKLDKKSRFKHIHFCFHYDLHARNCMLLIKSSFSLEDVSQAPQQCEIEGRRTEFHNASPNSTRL